MKEYDELLSDLTTSTIKLQIENKLLKKRIRELEFELKKYKHLEKQNKEKIYNKYGYIGTAMIIPSAGAGLPELEEE